MRRHLIWNDLNVTVFSLLFSSAAKGKEECKLARHDCTGQARLFWRFAKNLQLQYIQASAGAVLAHDIRCRFICEASVYDFSKCKFKSSRMTVNSAYVIVVMFYIRSWGDTVQDKPYGSSGHFFLQILSSLRAWRNG